MDEPTLNEEVEAAFQQFVADGGLDRTTATDEDYERMIRQQVYCKHALPRQKCVGCKTVTKSDWHWPGSGN